MLGRGPILDPPHPDPPAQLEVPAAALPHGQYEADKAHSLAELIITMQSRYAALTCWAASRS